MSLTSGETELDSDVVLIGITNPSNQGRSDMLANEADDEWTELHSIAASGSVRLFENWVRNRHRTLLNIRRTFVTVDDIMEYTPLLIAIDHLQFDKLPCPTQSERTELIKQMLRYGADPNGRGNSNFLHGTTPIICASYANYPEAISTLIDFGGNVHLKSLCS